jgi:RNA polymerase II subunit A small phosphatase-like protein
MATTTTTTMNTNTNTNTNTNMNTNTARKLLVLDLDHTLIYSSVIERSEVDFTFSLDREVFWVKRRPYLTEFLTEMAQLYDLAVWSAASRPYIEVILKHILPEGVSLVRVYDGRRCTVKDITFGDTARTVIKKLRKMWRGPYNRTNTLILDDTPVTYCQNYGNAIPIYRYYGSDTDTELLRVNQLLRDLVNVPNVRVVNKRYFS